jgi:hypothetical protein
MNHLLIRHKVADFAKWKTAYDAHAGARQAAGLTELHLLQGIDDPNEVVILFTATDLDKVKALTSSEDMRTVMQNAGVIGKPDFLFLS